MYANFFLAYHRSFTNLQGRLIIYFQWVNLKKKIKKNPWDWEQEDYLLEGGARVCDPNKKLNKWEVIMYNFYTKVHF